MTKNDYLEDQERIHHPCILRLLNVQGFTQSVLIFI